MKITEFRSVSIYGLEFLNLFSRRSLQENCVETMWKKGTVVAVHAISWPRSSWLCHGV